MKLRQETIDAIINETKEVKAVIAQCNAMAQVSNIEGAFDFFEIYASIGDTLDVVTDKAKDYSLNEGYFYIITPHTETNIQWGDNGLELGTIEVWEDEDLCGTWRYEQIVNNEVEFYK